MAAGSGATAQLEQRLGAAQLELRKLGSERHSLRARLRSETDRVRELESALRAEKELRRQAADEHQTAVQGLRTRLAELEKEKDQALAKLSAELGQARSAPARPAAAGAAPAAKAPLGLRRIRGIGPAFQRALEQLGVTRVEQIAAWSATDVASFAEKLKIRPDRIGKDDWVGQARQLEPER
jgi:NADH-quinone oxidoreductase subunit E